MTAINKGGNKFFVGEDEQNPLGEITFEPSGDNVLIIDHTYVADELRGQGMAGKLVDRVVRYAREEGKKIKPTCSYAKDKLEKTPEYHDVLAG
ncbi:GNAT family N-acetyltransferase [Virgibacillus sp. JSM 102003]|uniref:GNAT family N-acetyltransferase n=1 Tax=Virgibacillus sp. JSM 102003 TaxID=1562108 RepID=UPI0035BF1827